MYLFSFSHFYLMFYHHSGYLFLNFCFCYSYFPQLVTVMDMHAVVVSIWNCSSYLVVYQVVYVKIVDTQPPDDIVIIAKRATTRIQPNQLIVAKFVNVSLLFLLTICLNDNYFEIKAYHFSLCSKHK